MSKWWGEGLWGPSLPGHRLSCIGCWLWFLHLPVPDVRIEWYTDVSAITHVVPRMFLPSDFEKMGWNRFYATPVYCVYTPHRIIYKGVSGFATGCACGVRGRPWINQWPLYVGPFLGKFFLNQFVCMFNKMENIFSLLYKNIDSACQYIFQFALFLFSSLK